MAMYLQADNTLGRHQGKLYNPLEVRMSPAWMNTVFFLPTNLCLFLFIYLLKSHASTSFIDLRKRRAMASEAISFGRTRTGTCPGRRPSEQRADAAADRGSRRPSSRRRLYVTVKPRTAKAPRPWWRKAGAFGRRSDRVMVFVEELEDGVKLSDMVRKRETKIPTRHLQTHRDVHHYFGESPSIRVSLVAYVSAPAGCVIRMPEYPGESSVCPSPLRAA